MYLMYNQDCGYDKINKFLKTVYLLYFYYFLNFVVVIDSRCNFSFVWTEFVLYVTKHNCEQNYL